LALLAGIAVGGHLVPVAAAPSSSDARLRTLRDQVAEASAEESALLARIDTATARRRVLDARVAATDGAIANVQAELDDAQRRFDGLQMQVVVIQARMARVRRELAAAKDDLRRRALAAYMGQSDANRYADILLHASNLRELAATSGYLRAVIHAQRASVHRHQVLSDQVERLRDQVERARLGAKAGRDAVAARRAELERSRREASALRHELVSVITTQGRALGEVQSRKEEFETQIAALQAASDSVAALLRDRQAGEIAPPARDGLFARPVSGPVTSTFGPRVHPIFGNVRIHAGVDFGVATGASIRAAGDGVVVIAGPYGGYGNATVIDHGNALATLYGHQSAILVSPGDHVRRGQVIGRVGCSGYCTGPHLHFEVRVYGTPVDPLRYL
jgi:murein DD-endopeptidase MepM/ murein hydrolase activator NlpD